MNKLILFIIGLFFSLQVWAANPLVRIDTNMGSMDIELYADKAPKTVENFLRYVNEDFFSNTIFHRVIKNFMIQGGGFTPAYEKKRTHSPIANEADNGLKNNRGTIAMARTSAPHSATAQFFINTKDNDFLNHSSKTSRGWGYAVFGKLIRGEKVMDKIEASKTSSGGPFSRDVPSTQVIINSIKLIKE